MNLYVHLNLRKGLNNIQLNLSEQIFSLAIVLNF